MNNFLLRSPREQRDTARNARARVRRGMSVTETAARFDISRAYYYVLVKSLEAWEDAHEDVAMAECVQHWATDLKRARQLYDHGNGLSVNDIMDELPLTVPNDIMAETHEVDAMPAADDPLLA